MLLSHNLADVGNIVAGGHEVCEVVELQLIVTTRDDGFAASLDGYHEGAMMGRTIFAYQSARSRQSTTGRLRSAILWMILS